MKKIVVALSCASGAAILLYLIGALRNQDFEYWYLTYNLGLAVIPLFLALWLRRLLKTRQWNEWRMLLLALTWLLFLPNSFYIVTDFIHLPETQRVDIVQDVVMLMQFSVVGLVLGFMSVYLLHKAYAKLLSARMLTLVVGMIFLLSSFAIYLGRELRWNSWDIVTQPWGLMRDVGDHLVNPGAHPEAFMMTFSFFIMLASLYGLLWQLTKTLRRGKL